MSVRRDNKYQLAEFQPETCYVSGGPERGGIRGTEAMPRKVASSQPRYFDDDYSQPLLPGPVYILMPPNVAQMYGGPAAMYPPRRSQLTYGDRIDGGFGSGYYSPQTGVYRRGQYYKDQCCAAWKCCLALMIIMAILSILAAVIGIVLILLMEQSVMSSRTYLNGTLVPMSDRGPAYLMGFDVQLNGSRKSMEVADGLMNIDITDTASGGTTSRGLILNSTENLPIRADLASSGELIKHQPNISAAFDLDPANSTTSPRSTSANEVGISPAADIVGSGTASSVSMDLTGNEIPGVVLTSPSGLSGVTKLSGSVLHITPVHSNLTGAMQFHHTRSP